MQTVGKFRFAPNTEQIVVYARCAMCEPRYGTLINEENPFTWYGALGILAGHLDYFHHEYAVEDAERQLAVLRGAEPAEGLVDIVFRPLS